jgi:hypothetical protein
MWACAITGGAGNGLDGGLLREEQSVHRSRPEQEVLFMGTPGKK